jgi:hypothetical protein
LFRQFLLKFLSMISNQSRTQSNACARARMALALGKLNFSCAEIGLTFINRACRQRTGTPKFRGSGCQFPQSQCHPSPRTGIALGTRLDQQHDTLLPITPCAHTLKAGIAYWRLLISTPAWWSVDFYIRTHAPMSINLGL